MRNHKPLIATILLSLGLGLANAQTGAQPDQAPSAKPAPAPVLVTKDDAQNIKLTEALHKKVAELDASAAKAKKKTPEQIAADKQKAAEQKTLAKQQAAQEKAEHKAALKRIQEELDRSEAQAKEADRAKAREIVAAHKKAKEQAAADKITAAQKETAKPAPQKEAPKAVVQKEIEAPKAAVQKEKAAPILLAQATTQSNTPTVKEKSAKELKVEKAAKKQEALEAAAKVKAEKRAAEKKAKEEAVAAKKQQADRDAASKAAKAASKANAEKTAVKSTDKKATEKPTVKADDKKPAAPVAATPLSPKEQKLQELKQRYLDDKISPSDYQIERKKINRRALIEFDPIFSPSRTIGGLFCIPDQKQSGIIQSMHSFCYQRGKLYCEGVSVETLAREHGTPLYVYSCQTVARHYQALDHALAPLDHQLCFAMKANSNLAILSLLAKWAADLTLSAAANSSRRLQREAIPPSASLRASPKPKPNWKKPCAEAFTASTLRAKPN